MQTANTTTRSFDAWLAALRDVCGSFDSKPECRQRFQGSVSKRHQAGIEIAGITTNVERIFHRQPPSTSDETEHCFLVVQKQGQATLVQNNQQLKMRPGEMALLDSAKACEILPHGLIEHDSFHLPREELRRHFGEQPIPFMKISANCASGQILKLIVSRMVTGQITATETESISHSVTNSLISLLPAIYQNQQPSAMLLEQAGDTLYECILRFIDHHLHEDELGPALMAEQFHISTRQLYRLFEQHDESVCRYVQYQRLERCAEELASQQKCQQSITQIAYKWGFTDSAHFSRSFKRRFNSSPREYRRMSLNNAS